MRNLIYYTKFSENVIFSDKALNVFMNQFYTFLVNSQDQQLIFDNFLIDGSVALSLQKVETEKNIKDFRISVSSLKLFSFIRSSISTLPIDSFVMTESQIKIKTSGKLLQIDFIEISMKKIEINGIWVRDKNEIKY